MLHTVAQCCKVRGVNVFVLDADPVLAAEMLCLRHLGKMLLESAQLLCSAAPPGAAVPYRRTHRHHPCTRWVETTPGAWGWLVAHARALAARYERVWGRQHRHPWQPRHKSADVVEAVADLRPCQPATPDVFALVMPVELRSFPTPITEARPWLATALYRCYYRCKAREWAAKGRPMRWAGEPPAWMNDGAEVVNAREGSCLSRS